MTNKTFLLVFILLACLGCGLADRVQKAVTEDNANIATNSNTNKSLTDTAVETAIGEQKIGIPECDEALELLAAQANDPNDNFIVKAGKRTMLNTFREQLKRSLDENRTDKKEVADMCREFKKELEKSLLEENTNTAVE